MRGWRIGVGAAALLLPAASISACGLIDPGGTASGPVTAPGSTSPTLSAASASPAPSASSSPAPSSSTPSSPDAGSGGSDRPIATVPDVEPQGFTTAPAGSGLSRYTEQKLTWKACRDKEECASIKVPLDYAHPNGQAITLALARRPSTAKTSAGSLFVNPGGPGASGIDFLDSFSPDGLRDYDIVSWDPRGVGASTPVECFTGKQMQTYTEMDSSPDTSAEVKAWEAENKAFGRSCLARSGALLQHISTDETVRDLDVLRQVVGSTKLDYFGFSYGTSIGARYAQLFPTEVGRMVLDGATWLGNGSASGYATGGVSQSVGFDRALDDFASWAADHDSPLGSSRKAVLKQITGLFDRLDAKPLTSGSRELTQTLAVTGVTLLLYQNESYYKYLDEALSAAAVNRDGSALIFYADQLNERAKDGSYGQTNYAFPAIRCLDSPDDGVAAALKEWKAEEKGSTFGKYFGPDFTCPTWPVAPSLNNDGSLNASGAAPIVVVGTTRDPATPYEGAQAMARQLSSGVLLTLKGDGHTAYDQSACIKSKVNRYLLQGTVPKDGTTCSS